MEKIKIELTKENLIRMILAEYENKFCANRKIAEHITNEDFFDYEVFTGNSFIQQSLLKKIEFYDNLSKEFSILSKELIKGDFKSVSFFISKNISLFLSNETNLIKTENYSMRGSYGFSFNLFHKEKLVMISLYVKDKKEYLELINDCIKTAKEKTLFDNTTEDLNKRLSKIRYEYSIDKNKLNPCLKEII